MKRGVFTSEVTKKKPNRQRSSAAVKDGAVAVRKGLCASA